MSLPDDDEHDGPLLPAWVRDADDRRFCDRAVSAGGVLQIDRADPLPARFDDILQTIGDAQCAASLDRRQVAGPEPAVAIENRDIGSLEITRGTPVGFHLQMTYCGAIVGQPAALVIDEADLRSEHRTPLRCARLR